MVDYRDLVHYLEDILLDIQAETHYLRDIKDNIDKNNLMITCPNHKGGQESSPSCGLELKTGVCHCLTCGWKGNLISLSKLCRGEEFGFKYLINRYLEKKQVSTEYKKKLIIKKPEEEAEVIIPDYKSIFEYKDAVEYLLSRKISKDIMAKFDIRYSPDKKMVMIPIYSGNTLVGYKGRKIIKCDKKFRFYNTPNMKKVLFGLDKIEKGDAVLLTEAEIDCLTLWSWGLEAISILGANITPLQKELLRRSNIKRLIIALDNDDVGRQASLNLMQELKDLDIEINLLTYKSGVTQKDANDFNSLEDYKKSIQIVRNKKTLRKY